MAAASLNRLVAAASAFVTIQAWSNKSMQMACSELLDGSYCKGDVVVHCAGQTAVNYTECTFDSWCSHHAGGFGIAGCTTDWCSSQPDGVYCNHEDRWTRGVDTEATVECRDQKTVKTARCSLHEECHGNGAGLRVASCVDVWCNKRVDGTYCKGRDDRLVQCQNQMTANVTDCYASGHYCKDYRLDVNSQVGAAACTADSSYGGYGSQSYPKLRGSSPGDARR
eukprot:TRINITY_DN50677_c0_g1_i1.p1 TRINITY_DN50677_c0_g1~~TRINITY_DN50677_c0_g1_i1.p1  ORF type:complete len:248 (-),score=43.20 TRINITY_DN50677_c0_g1_i1:52-723(-)